MSTQNPVAPVRVIDQFSFDSTSNITGTVRDPQGAAVPEAEVTITDKKTRAIGTITSTEDGLYNFPSLPAGTYTIAVAPSGFKKRVSTGVEHRVNENKTVNLDLEVGQVTETVTVTVEATRRLFVFPAGDSIQEFRVERNSFSGEFGRLQGAVANLITKGGSNDFHGNAFESFGNNSLKSQQLHPETAPASRSLVLVLVTCQLVIQAQGTTGSIPGTVTDQTGAVVPGANVTVKGEAGQKCTAATNGTGVFTIRGVPAGTYTVTITAPSFKTAVIQNVKVDVATPATVNAQLEPGNINETVVVASGAEVLQTETATVGTTITGRQILETPIQSRDALDLVTTLPGTTTTGVVRTSSINGLPKSALTIQIDGVDMVSGHVLGQAS